MHEHQLNHSSLAYYYGLFVLLINVALFGTLDLLHMVGGFEGHVVHDLLSMIAGYMWIANFIIVGFGAFVMLYAMACASLDALEKKDTLRNFARALFGLAAFCAGGFFWVVWLFKVR